MLLIDSHCHLDFDAFAPDRAAVLARAHAQGIRAIVVPGVSAERWPGLLALTMDTAGLYPALGLHPMFLAQHQDAHLAELERLLRQRRDEVVAVGEIGLDFWLPELDPQRQMALFIAQLRLAKQYELPVLLHVRKAHDQVLKQLRQWQLPRAGIVHAFSGSRQQADEYLKLGFKLGFGGAITFDRANKLRRIAAQLPLEAIVLETDAPDMAPAAHYRQRNEPAYLLEALRTLAQLRAEPIERIAHQTSANACAILRLVFPDAA